MEGDCYVRTLLCASAMVGSGVASSTRGGPANLAGNRILEMRIRRGKSSISFIYWTSVGFCKHFIPDVLSQKTSFPIELNMAPGILIDGDSQTAYEQPSTTSIKDRSNDCLSHDDYGHYYPVNPNTLNLESNFGPMYKDSIGYVQPTSAEASIEEMRD